MAEEEVIEVTEEKVIETTQEEEEVVEVKDEVAVKEEGAEEEVEKEEVVEEEVPPPEAPQANVLHLANEALCAWKRIYKQEKPKADDTWYYAEELFVEDQKFWEHGKHKVHHTKEWTVEQFGEELEKLKAKQQPVWDLLIKQADEIAAKLEKPAEDVKNACDKVKASLGPHPFNKVVPGKPAPTSQEEEIRHEFHYKLDQEFKDAKVQYQEICGYPEGLLPRVKLARINVVREDINITEALHDEQMAERNRSNLAKIFKVPPVVFGAKGVKSN